MPNVQCYLKYEEMKKFRLLSKMLGMSETSFLKSIILERLRKMDTLQ
jgi:hypothetical protein